MEFCDSEIVQTLVLARHKCVHPYDAGRELNVVSWWFIVPTAWKMCLEVKSAYTFWHAAALR